MTETKEKPKREVAKRNAAEIHRGLVALAYANGNSRMAAAALAEDGFEIDDSTLRDWRVNRHTAEYERIRAEVLPRIREQAGDEHLALARRQMKASQIATEEWLERRGELKASDLSTAARNFDVGSGIHSQHAQVFHDQPTQHIKVDLPAVLKELKSLGVEPDVVLDAEVVEEEDVDQASGVNGVGSEGSAVSPTPES